MSLSAVDGLADLLDGAANIAVAVDTRGGPHVTPELFVTSGDRMWCLTAATTLKAKILRKRPRAGILVQRGDTTAVLAADATVIDPARPLAALANGAAAVRAPAVVAEFLARNHMEMVGAAMDAASLQLGAPPPRRVLIGFEPVASAIVAGTELVSSDGWAPAAQGDGYDVDAAGEVPLGDLPADLAQLLDRDAAVLGWRSPTGPLALPAAWCRAAGQATVAGGVFAAVGAAQAGPCSLMVDDWTGLGPTGKRGVMLRGEGTAAADGPAVVVRVAADRAAFWQGVETGTVS